MRCGKRVLESERGTCLEGRDTDTSHKLAEPRVCMHCLCVTMETVCGMFTECRGTMVSIATVTVSE